MPNSDEITHVSKKQKEVQRRAPFYRAAAEGEFADGFFNTLDGGKIAEDRWLHKREFETVETFSRRLCNVQNYDYSKKIVNSYVGILSKVNKNIEITAPDAVKEKLLENVDNLNHTMDSFLNAIATELLTVGKTYVGTDIDEMPFSQLIKREKVMDKLIDQTTANFEYFKFRRDKMVLNGYKTEKRHDIIIYTEDEIYKCIPLDNQSGIQSSYKVDEVLKNGLKFIPIRQASLGLEGQPIIKSSAHMDLNLVNIDSELRDLLSVQALSLLMIPESAQEKIGGVIKANSLIIVPDDYSGAKPEWVAYPAQSLDGHFKYLESTIAALHELSNLRRQGTKQQQSGQSKKMDFLDTESILNLMADELETIFDQIVSDWSAFLDINIEASIKIDRKFDIDELNDILDRIDKALLLRLGNEVERALKKKAVSTIVDLTAEQKIQSDLEIDDMAIESEIMEDELSE